MEGRKSKKLVLFFEKKQRIGGSSIFLIEIAKKIAELGVTMKCGMSITKTRNWKHAAREVLFIVVTLPMRFLKISQVRILLYPQIICWCF